MPVVFKLELGPIHETALIGLPPEMRDYRRGRRHHGVEVADGARVGAFCTVDGGWEAPTVIGKCWLMKHVHVGHDARVGDGCEIAPHTSIGGYVTLGRNVKVGQSACFKPYVTVGDGAVIGMGAVVTKNVPAGETWAGNPARLLRDRAGFDPAERALWDERYPERPMLKRTGLNWPTAA